MNKTMDCDIAVIGGGSGGLSVAAGAAMLGAKVVLIEEGKMGGDCLNYGCVPSKSLLAAGKAAQTAQRAEHYGLTASVADVDIAKVMNKVSEAIKAIEPHDSVERFEGLGVKLIKSHAEFIDSRTIKAGDVTVNAKRFVIATGSSPAAPPIPGLDTVAFLTNETIFNLKEKPDHLLVIGGGPIGCELAQAFRMLGVKVTILEAFSILPKDEVDLVAILRDELKKQGITIVEQAKVSKLSAESNAIQVQIEINGKQETITGSHLLVAAGRRVNVDGLGLEKAGVDYSRKGIVVDKRLRTSNRRIYAIGDVAGGYQFTHIANYHAGIVIRNILFRLPAKVDYKSLPWVTYTLPELAHAGLTSEAALKQDPDAKIISCDLSEIDRAQAEHDTTGKIKLIASKKGKVLGVSILAPHAGEMILPWVMMIREGRSLRSLTDAIVPYPTYSELSKRVASEFYAPALFSDKVKWLVRMLLKLG